MLERPRWLSLAGHHHGSWVKPTRRLIHWSPSATIRFPTWLARSGTRAAPRTTWSCPKATRPKNWLERMRRTVGSTNWALTSLSSRCSIRTNYIRRSKRSSPRKGFKPNKTTKETNKQRTMRIRSDSKRTVARWVAQKAKWFKKPPLSQTTKMVDLKRLSQSMTFPTSSSRYRQGAWLKEWAWLGRLRRWSKMLRKRQPSNTITLVVEIKWKSTKTRTIESRPFWCWLLRGGERKFGCLARQCLTSEVENTLIKSQVSAKYPAYNEKLFI